LLSVPPLLYLLLLAAAVSIGFPAGFLVVGAGSLYGPSVGIATVLVGEALGLAINWQICRGVFRPRMQRWLSRHDQLRRFQPLMLRPASMRLLLLLRLSLIPMNVVNAACALGPTSVQRYALACLALVPRFALMVLAGSVGAEALRNSPTPTVLAFRLLLLATTVVLVLLLLHRYLHSSSNVSHPSVSTDEADR
jgi:uncharacterized membrane protein YdjX (TVP38/TMEM64 family)